MSENQIDPDLSRWILEFLLHQELEDPILNPITEILPIPDQNSTLPKLFLLRKLQSEVTKGGISENVLDLLDEIYELDRNIGGKDCSECLKRAYCAVAVECSVRCLGNGWSDVKGEFFEVVKRVWRGRVGGMEEGGVGLVSEELLEWKDDIEAAVWEESVCRRVVERGRGVDGVEAVRGYVRDERSRMGPSFLELVSETLSSDAENRGDCRDDSLDDGGKTVVGDGGKRKGLRRRKHAAYKRARPVTSKSCKGVKIVDVDDLGASHSCDDHLVGTHEVNRVQETPDEEDIEPTGDQNLELPQGQDGSKSSEEDAGKAQSDEANLGVENMCVEPTGDQDRAKSPGVDNVVDVETGEANADNTNCSGPSNAPKSLMERNKTAHTLAWNDSIDNSSVDPSDSTLRPQLPSPRERRVLPSNMFKEPNPRPPRKKMWSNVEEDTLRAGVRKFGKGYWKLILDAYRDIFVGRTTVDLKDKWRNMTRHG